MKVRKVTGRGTGIITTHISKQNWAGDDFKKLQKGKLDQFGENLSIHVGRGGKTMKIKDIPEPKKTPSTFGITKISSRGTRSHKSKD